MTTPADIAPAEQPAKKPATKLGEGPRPTPERIIPVPVAVPPFADAKGRRVAAPDFAGVLIADTHAHLDMLDHPGFALANAARAGVGFVATVCDPSEDAERTYAELDRWIAEADELLAADAAAVADADGSADAASPTAREPIAPARVRVIVGVHPHNAKAYTAEVEAAMRLMIADPRTSAVGEIGLDYFYDQSPRDVQRVAFEAQLRLAHEFALPAVVHLREAHDDGLRILRSVGVLEAGCILHCYNLGPDLLGRFLELGCTVSFAGPVSFKKSTDVREAAALVPIGRILTETDCPFMAPEPFRGRVNEPAFTVFTAAAIAGARAESLPEFAAHAWGTALSLLDRER